MRGLLVAVAICASLPGGEVRAAGALAFPAVDTNRDGVVTWEEAKRKMQRLFRVHFEKCDLNRDGVIDQGEYPLLSTFYWMNYVMPE